MMECGMFLSHQIQGIGDRSNLQIVIHFFNHKLQGRLVRQDIYISQYIFILLPELRYHEFKKYLSNHILKNPRKVAHWKIAPRKIAPHPKPNPRPNPNPREDFVGGNLPGDNFPVTILKLCKAPNQSVIKNIIMFFLRT